MVYISEYDSEAGKLTLAADENKLIGLWFDGQKHFGSTLPHDCKCGTSPAIESARNWLDIYFSGEEPHFLPPLSFRTTPFRTAVWKMLLTIPYGQTITYGELAARLAADGSAAKMSARAVGGAVGHNPISVIVPCHRVVGANGSLTGYAGGIDKKIKLLGIEKAAVAQRRQNKP